MISIHVNNSKFTQVCRETEIETKLFGTLSCHAPMHHHKLEN